MEKLDQNRDGKISLGEFIKGCLSDEDFLYLLAPNAVTKNE